MSPLRIEIDYSAINFLPATTVPLNPYLLPYSTGPMRTRKASGRRHFALITPWTQLWAYTDQQIAIGSLMHMSSVSASLRFNYSFEPTHIRGAA